MNKTPPPSMNFTMQWQGITVAIGQGARCARGFDFVRQQLEHYENRIAVALVNFNDNHVTNVNEVAAIKQLIKTADRALVFAPTKGSIKSVIEPHGGYMIVSGGPISEVRESLDVLALVQRMKTFHSQAVHF